MQAAAEGAVDTHRDDQRVAGVHIEMLAAWTVTDIAIATEARLRMAEHVMNRLRDAGLAVAGALWPNMVQPQTVSRLALEAGAAWLDAWRASAARADAEMALSFALSWYPSIDLGRLTARWAGVEEDLVRRVTPLAVRASDIASFSPHDEFILERAADGTALLADDFGLAFEDPDDSEGETEGEGTGSSTGAYADANAEEDTGATENPAQSGADAPVA